MKHLIEGSWSEPSYNRCLSCTIIAAPSGVNFCRFCSWNPAWNLDFWTFLEGFIHTVLLSSFIHWNIFLTWHFLFYFRPPHTHWGLEDHLQVFFQIQGGMARLLAQCLRMVLLCSFRYIRFGSMRDVLRPLSLAMQCRFCGCTAYSPSSQVRKWNQEPFCFYVVTLQGLIGPICQLSEAGLWSLLSSLACFLPLCWHWSTFVKFWPCPS